MNISPVLGFAKLLVKSRKTKLILIGAQLGYIGYKYLKNRKRKHSKSKSGTIKTSNQGTR